MRKFAVAVARAVPVLAALFTVAALWMAQKYDPRYLASGAHHHLPVKVWLLPLAACAALEVVVLVLTRKKGDSQQSRRSRGRRAPSWR